MRENISINVRSLEDWRYYSFRCLATVLRHEYEEVKRSSDAFPSCPGG